MTAFQRLPFHSTTLLMASWPEAEALMTKFDAASAYRNAASFGSPAFGNELTGKILRGHGAPVWSLVGSIHFYCYCGHGQVDADLSPRCWLLSSLFRWFSHRGPPASVCHNNLQACIQLCSKVGLPVHLGKLEGPSTCWAQSCYRPGFPLKRESDLLCWVPYWSPPPCVQVRPPG